MMNLTVLTPDKTLFKGLVTSVKIPGALGEFQVLKNHAPIVSALEHGKVTIVVADGEVEYYDAESGDIESGLIDGNRYLFTIEKGFIEVLNNEISLLVQGISDIRLA